MFAFCVCFNGSNKVRIHKIEHQKNVFVFKTKIPMSVFSIALACDLILSENEFSKRIFLFFEDLSIFTFQLENE